MRGSAVSEADIRHGSTTVADTAEAVRAFCASIAQPDIGFAAVFCSPRHDRAVLARELSAAFPGANVVGCTTAGEVTLDGYVDGSITGLSLAGDICFSVSRLIPHISAFQRAEGREIVSALVEEIKRRGGQPSPLTTFAFLLIDGQSFMEEQVTSAISAALGTIPLFGGSAGDDRRHRKTFVYCDGGFHTDAAVLTLVHTCRPFKVFSTQHFVGTGEQAVVTAADPARRLILELNGESAAVEYARLLGQDLDQLRADRSMLPPLVVRIGGAYYARSIERIGPDNSLTMACVIDEGVPLSVGRNTGMLPNLERCFEDVRRSIGAPQVVIGADCCMRKAESAGMEGELSRIFRENRVVGFSAYGEQINAMHVNHTFTGVAIGGGAERVKLSPPPERADNPLERLEEENAKLRKTVRVLLQRLERSMNVPGDTFSLFQNTVLLEETVRQRTADLAEANQQLSRELITRREIEAALLQAKADADRANASKTQFLAAISHDLQQPLNAALLLLGAVLEEPLTMGGRNLVGRIEAALQTTEDMLGDFLDVAKLESGAVAHQNSEFTMGPLLNQLAAEYQPQARRRGLSLRVVPSNAAVRTDRRLFQRILRNLLANALRYTSEGRVLLGCRRRGDRLFIEVWDTGAGIPDSKRKDIFRPFYQLNRAGHMEDGSGLGLTIVERLCQVLGLVLEIQSQEGRGSMFRVGVPLGAPVHASSPFLAKDDPSAPAALLAGKRIVAIDDDPEAADGLSAILKAWKCQPMIARDVDELLRLLDPEPDLLIVDFHLGRQLTGLDVLDRIEAVLPNRPGVIVVSADRSPDIRAEVGNRGCAFLPKPIKPAKLRSVMTYMLCSASAI